jgi:tetratricopeptide (TPR) repeat protein
MSMGELYAQLGDRRGCAVADINTGYGWMMIGAYERAETALREGMRLAGELRLTRALAAARHNLGMVLALRGDFAQAMREESEALEAMVRAHDDRLTVVSRLYLAMIQEMAGELAAAEATTRRALGEVDNLPPVKVRTIAVLARILLRAGRHDEASALLPRLVESLQTSLVEGGDCYPRLVHAEILLAAGRRSEAETVLRALEKDIRASAAFIGDEALRAGYLQNVPENARALALAEELGINQAG